MFRSVRAVRFLLFGVAVCGLLLAGCSGTERITHNSAEEAYQKASERFADEDYETAIRYYRAVFEYGRGTDVAPDAQFELARAHEERGEHILAATEYNRFTQLYRNHPRLADAEYRRALMYYNQSPHYKLDQSDTERALANFDLYMQRHPNHERVDDAQEKVSELRNKLARKQFEAGELYERRRMYRAAAYTYERVFDKYPDSDYADRALLASIRTFIDYSDRSVEQRQAERLESAIANYERLTQVFPNSPHLVEAERHYERAQSRLERIREREEEQIAQDTQ